MSYYGRLEEALRKEPAPQLSGLFYPEVLQLESWREECSLENGKRKLQNGNDLMIIDVCKYDTMAFSFSQRKYLRILLHLR